MATRSEDLYRVGRAEYLRGEESAPVKSEWISGVVYNMAGASKAHVRTVGRIMRRLQDRADERSCLLGSSDLLVETGDAFYYPDVVLSCDSSDDERIERHPCFIAEVLSPSTQRLDRHEKRDAYRLVETMMDYWIVDPVGKVVEVWTRTEVGWRGSHHVADDVLHVECLALDIRVVDIVGV